MPAISCSSIEMIRPTPCAGYTTNSLGRKSGFLVLVIQSVPRSEGLFRRKMTDWGKTAPAIWSLFRQKILLGRAAPSGGSGVRDCLCALYNTKIKMCQQQKKKKKKKSSPL